MVALPDEMRTTVNQLQDQTGKMQTEFKQFYADLLQGQIDRIDEMLSPLAKRIGMAHTNLAPGMKDLTDAVTKLRHTLDNSTSPSQIPKTKSPMKSERPRQRPR